MGVGHNCFLKARFGIWIQGDVFGGLLMTVDTGQDLVSRVDGPLWEVPVMQQVTCVRGLMHVRDSGDGNGQAAHSALSADE